MMRRLQALVVLGALLCGFGARAGSSLLWFEDGRPSADALEVASLLAQAELDGLDASDYHAAAIARALDAARRGALPGVPEQAQLDALLSAALLHFLSDRQNGRIDPHLVHARFGPITSRLPPSATDIASAVRQHRLHEWLQQTRPQWPMYDALRHALAQYRALAGHAAWLRPLPALPRRKLSLGQPYAGLSQLAQRLQALGDLPPDVPPDAVLSQPLANSLQRFQTRHGLLADGILGTATLQQLDITPAQRVRQIALTLERLRWTPYLEDARMIVVNLPEFVLRAYEVQNQRITVRLSMKVIVGKAMNTRTPLIEERMRFIEFNPYWNVPPSIARQELVPRLRRDPAYFGQQGFEFVSHDGSVATTLSAQGLDATLAGSWRIRQRPGPLNALGDIKFVFPNNDNIYLHHTSAPQLFERQRRDFSHGCIRVAEPVALALFALQDQPDWDAARVEAAMAGEQSSTVVLRTPVPVLISYSTVIVKGDQVFFFPDLYGHDRLLDQALRQHSDRHTDFVPLTP